MQSFINNIVHRLLNLIGLKTINSQFLFSYLTIFILALVSTATLYFSLDSSADAINVAGRQRMLSQRLAKEALLVGQGVENQVNVQKTIDLFESSHKKLMNGAAEEKFPAITSKDIISQMAVVQDKWLAYKTAIDSYLKTPNEQALKEIKTLSVDVLKNMHKAVGMMADEANETALNQMYIAFGTSIAILFLVFLGRQFGMRTLMLQFSLIKERLCSVSIGNFSMPLEIDDLSRDNEIGELYGAYNTMLVRVGDLLRGVEGSVEQVKHSVAQVREATTNTSAGISQQEIEISAISSSISEMSGAVTQVAETAVNSAQSTDETKNVADQGYKVIQKSHSNVNELSGQMDNTANVLKELEKDIQEVSQVLSVITSIAEQTNLLALNAAIEAARAGEQGRGFAVVADEVRTLAQRTQESTEEIRKIIESLQNQSDKAVKAMGDSQLKVKETVEENSKATSLLQSISQLVNKVSEQMNYIASASEEQSQSAREIDKSTHSISKVAQQTSDASQALVQASNDIDVQMTDLEAMVHKFKHQ